eukprot:c7730_g1_i2.p1 GENE.c7730_g1_i2~~c7730_g1_i2.p1  ORF type:complete len:205 (+),score=2.03 c7730_g1_i2:60-674(+)
MGSTSTRMQLRTPSVLIFTDGSAYPDHRGGGGSAAVITSIAKEEQEVQIALESVNASKTIKAAAILSDSQQSVRQARSTKPGPEGAYWTVLEKIRNLVIQVSKETNWQIALQERPAKNLGSSNIQGSNKRNQQNPDRDHKIQNLQSFGGNPKKTTNKSKEEHQQAAPTALHKIHHDTECSTATPTIPKGGNSKRNSTRSNRKNQ